MVSGEKKPANSGASFRAISRARSRSWTRQGLMVRMGLSGDGAGPAGGGPGHLLLGGGRTGRRCCRRGGGMGEVGTVGTGLLDRPSVCLVHIRNLDEGATESQLRILN